MSRKEPWSVQWWDEDKDQACSKGCDTYEKALLTKRSKERAGFCGVRIVPV